MKKRTNQILGTLLCLATLLTACEKTPVNGGEETKPDEGGEVTTYQPDFGEDVESFFITNSMM